MNTATNTTEGGIYVDKVPQRVCEIVADLVAEDVDFTVNGADYTGSCGTENKIVFYHGAIDKALGNGNEPCSLPFIWNGTECVCPAGYSKYTTDYNDYETCYNNSNDIPLLCPPGSTWGYDPIGTLYCIDCPAGGSCDNGYVICQDETIYFSSCHGNSCDPCPSDATYSNGICICNDASYDWLHEGGRNMCSSRYLPEKPCPGTDPS